MRSAATTTIEASIIDPGPRSVTLPGKRRFFDTGMFRTTRVPLGEITMDPTAASSSSAATAAPAPTQSSRGWIWKPATSPTTTTGMTTSRMDPFRLPSFWLTAPSRRPRRGSSSDHPISLQGSPT